LAEGEFLLQYPRGTAALCQRAAEEQAAQKEPEKEAKEAAAEKAMVELLQKRKGAAQGQR
jgi:hypothetical protein